MDISSAINAAIAAAPPGVRVLQAVFVSADPTGAWVDIQKARVPATLGTAFLPEVGEIVNLWNIGELYIIVGPAAPKPSTGTVQSVAGGLVTLLSSMSTTVVCPYDGSGGTPSAGQVMKLVWHGGPFAFFQSTSPAPVTPPPAPTTGSSSHSQVFQAIDAGSYGSGRWWTAEVWASDSNLGAWFYGTKIADTIPSSASIQSVDIWVSAKQVSGSAPNFAVHPHPTNPGGVPSLTTVATMGVSGGWQSLPTSVGLNLKSGGGYFGIGLNHGGYNILHSLAQDGASGSLRIAYTA